MVLRWRASRAGAPLLFTTQSLGSCTFSGYLGVSRIQNKSPGLLYGSLNLPDMKENAFTLIYLMHFCGVNRPSSILNFILRIEKRSMKLDRGQNVRLVVSLLRFIISVRQYFYSSRRFLGSTRRNASSFRRFTKSTRRFLSSTRRLVCSTRRLTSSTRRFRIVGRFGVSSFRHVVSIWRFLISNRRLW